MAKYLKSGKSITEKENEDQKTKEIVENVLKQIENGGDRFRKSSSKVQTRVFRRTKCW